MSKKQVREQFGAHADSYKSSEVHARGASLARLVELVDPQPTWFVLDIATGAGHTAAAFAPFVKQVVAGDITPEMLAQTRQLAKEQGLSNVRIETADAESLPFDHASFDLVTCRIAPHHFSAIPAFISESYRVLKPSGLLAVVDNVVPPGMAGDYVNAFEKLRDPSHVRCLTTRAWSEALSTAGFDVLKQEELEKTMDFDFWAKRHDADLRAYLLALLFQAAEETSRFLQPRSQEGKITFQLREGLFICQK